MTPLVVETVRGVPVRCYARRPRSVVELLQDALARSADDALLVDPARGTTTTYAGFAGLVEGAAAALSARCAPGDRVAVLVRNGLEAAVAIWACARAGLVHLGVPVGAPPARVAELLALTTPSLLLAQPGLDLPGSDDAEAVLLSTSRPWDAARPLPDEDETYMLIATSGTTGSPKAVRVTGRMLGHAAVCYADLLALAPGDRTAVHLPFAWVSGHVTQLAPTMLSGGSIVTMAHFDAPSLVRVVAEHRVTWIDVVPSIWELLLRTEAFARERLPTLRAAVFGGAPAPAGTLDRVRERFPGLQLLDVYASSETCAPISTSGPDGIGVGRLAPYVDVRLEAGEVQVRSPAVTPGYWGGASPLTADGWLRTGDLGRLDDGLLTVGGRAVDLVIRGGVNVYPAEVEGALLATGLLRDAAVCGVPSRVTGENVAAGVVPLSPEPDLEVLRQAVRDVVGNHAVPRPLRVVDAVPRNANGKVDRAALRALLS